MEREIIQKEFVLDDKGKPVPGYSTKSILEYNRKTIKAPPWRIKEWDFYQVTDGSKCLQFTIGHASYAGQVSIMLFDFQRGKKILEKSKVLILPFHTLHMPNDAERDGTLEYHKHNIDMSFKTAGDTRILSCKWEEFEGEIILRRENPHALVINIPFDEDEHAFYYNHKINCMSAEGAIRVGNKSYYFNKEDSFGLLDWGRGVWPFHNEWYWSNGTGRIDGKIFGFNLGCGFGNTEAASENIIFWEGKAHKLGPVKFELGTNYIDPWRIRDTEGRLDLMLIPIYDRTTRTKMLWIDNCCHQMFGTFRGQVILDDGNAVVIDRIVAFAEHAINNW